MHIRTYTYIYTYAFIHIHIYIHIHITLFIVCFVFSYVSFQVERYNSAVRGGARAAILLHSTCWVRAKSRSASVWSSNFWDFRWADRQWLKKTHKFCNILQTFYKHSATACIITQKTTETVATWVFKFYFLLLFKSESRIGSHSFVEFSAPG